jgi:ATP-dependent Clp protease protease subunit
VSLRPWYRLTTNAAGETAELVIFDEIGKSFWNDDAVSAKQVLEELQALPTSVRALRVRVNSPGGDPFEAAVIANALRAQRTEKGRAVEVSIEGLAASAATVVTSAGAPIRMADNALYMIHDPIALVVGPAADMRKVADALDKIRDAIIATYQWVSPLEAAELAALMAAETWMSASEALARGLVTEVVASVQAVASFRPEAIARLGTVPEAYRARVEAWIARTATESPAPPEAVVKACTAAGVPELAEDLLGQPLSVVTARIEAVTRARAEAEAHAREIRALCGVAKLPELADGYVQARTPLPVVRAHLTTLTARLDRAEIDAHLLPDPDRGASARAALNPALIYAARNRRAEKE